MSLVWLALGPMFGAWGGSGAASAAPPERSSASQHGGAEEKEESGSGRVAAATADGVRLPAGLSVVVGPVNGGFIERGGRGLAVYGDAGTGRPTPDTLLLTHARRDAVWHAYAFAEGGAKVVAPEKEAAWLTDPGRFWEAWREKRFHDYAQQTTKVPASPLPVDRTVKGGEVLAWGGLEIRVLDTPGYTRGAVSYLVDLDGCRVAFTGDLLRGDGRLQDLYSFQDAIPEAKVGGYHGWAGRLGDLMASLDRLAAEKPDLLVPLRGPVIPDPAAAIQRLRLRVRAVYANYLSVDALRWYFKDEHIRSKARRVLGEGSEVDWMPMADTMDLPAAIVPIANARLILADDRSGFLVDCGGPGILDELRKMRAAGRLASIEHVFVTHYHDDHTDALPSLVTEFGARVHACGSLVDLIERPGDYQLPCLTKNPTQVTARHRDRDTWEWKEYRLTIFDHPGQTLHHNALLVERRGGWKACFVGDSFTPSGIDDYCLQNRNFLHEGRGYLLCLDQLERLPEGCLILNQHVGPAFRFSPGQIERMRETLRRRIPLLRELFTFDDPNYGLDEGWAMFHPYWVRVEPGGSARLALRLTNHSAGDRTFRARFRTPPGLRAEPEGAVQVGPRADGEIRLRVEAGEQAAAGLHVVVADLVWEGGELPGWSEAVVEVGR